MIEYEVLKEKIDEAKDEIKSLRSRTHRNENDISSTSSLVKETINNLSWCIDILKEQTKKLEDFKIEYYKDKEKKLEEKIHENTTRIQKIRGFFFSKEFIFFVGYALFSIALIGDILSFSSIIDKFKV